MRVAILDDIQDAWRDTAGVKRLRERAEVVIFTEPFGSPSALRGFDALIANRERTKLSRELLSQLPDVRVIAQTGNHAAHLDFKAAADLGSPPWRVFREITLPLSMPGVIAGSMLVFIPAVGEFVIPSLLGGPSNLMIGRVLWDEFFGNHDWPVASAVAVAFLLLLAGPIAIYQYYNVRQTEA